MSPISCFSSQIWRCPDFKLIPCKTPPKQCTSYRMIYIRHVHLECPACLICADALEPWTVPVQETTSTTKQTKKRSKHHKVSVISCYSFTKHKIQWTMHFASTRLFDHPPLVDKILASAKIYGTNVLICIEINLRFKITCC